LKGEGLVRAGELLAATATTIAQAARDESSDVWVPLLSALLGAIVGGAATLTGSVLVNRWELRRTARFRMYQELLPKVRNETWPRYRWHDDSREAQEAFERSLEALEREGAIAGELEWRRAVLAKVFGWGCADKIRAARLSGDKFAELSQDIQDDATRFENELRRLDKILQEHVRRLWPRIWPRLRQRLRLLGRKKPADLPRQATAPSSRETPGESQSKPSS
jgi:hypothetical protein